MPARVTGGAQNTTAMMHTRARWRYATPEHAAEAAGTRGAAGSPAHAPGDGCSSARGAASRRRRATKIIHRGKALRKTPTTRP